MNITILKPGERLAHPDLFDDAGTFKPILTTLIAGLIKSRTVDILPISDCRRAAGGTDFIMVTPRRRAM